MFGSLIRRKQTKRSLGEDNIAFEVDHLLFEHRGAPAGRPPRRRAADRHAAGGQADRCAGQRAADPGPQRLGGRADGRGRPSGSRRRNGLDRAFVAEYPSTVVWTREGTAGFKFEQNIDLGELLAGRKQRHGFRPRPPRLEVNCKANVKLENSYYTVDVHDISLGGMKVEPIEEYCLGKKVVVVVESLRPVRGEVRWFADRKAGIVFDQPLKFEELGEWIGKRLEVATLKASIKG